MKILSEALCPPDAAGAANRHFRPHGATHVQVVTYQGPAATTPSAYAHVILRGLATLQAAAPAGGPATAHWICEWDLLEHPYLYGTWIPLPQEVGAVAVVAGADPGCVGAVARGAVLWLIDEGHHA